MRAVTGLLEDIPALTEVLTYHVVFGSVLAETVMGLESAKPFRVLMSRYITDIYLYGLFISGCLF